MSISQFRSMLSDKEWTNFENSVKCSYKLLIDLRSKLTPDQQRKVHQLWSAIDYMKDCLLDIELDENGYLDPDNSNDDYAISDIRGIINQIISNYEDQ